MDETPKTVGRGKIIEFLKKQAALREVSEYGTSDNIPAQSSRSPFSQKDSSSEESVPARPAGRGRASFLLHLKNQAKSNTVIGVDPFPKQDVEPEHFSPRCDVSRSLSRTSDLGSSVTAGLCSDLSRLGVSHNVLNLPKAENSELVTRGGFGDTCKVSTNYVTLKTDPNKGVYQYHVSFSPAVDYAHYRFKILYEHFHDKKGKICYDGNFVLFMAEKITDGVLTYASKNSSDEPVIMSIKYLKKAEAKDCATLFNILFKNCFRAMNLTRLKNKYYDHRAVRKIPQHKLEIWPGFVTAVEEFEGGVHLQCDVHHRILRTDTPYDILNNIITRDPRSYKSQAEKELLGECVLTRYNNNLYRIDDIDWSKSPTSTFKLSSGQEITFIEYYKTQYNLDIIDDKQPLLIHTQKTGRGGVTKLICLVPELCHMTGLTDAMRNDIRVMKDVAAYTRVTPVQREQAFKTYLQNLKSCDEAVKILDNWGLILSDEPLNIDARNLKTEAIIFGHDKRTESIVGDWMKSVRDNQVYRSVDVRSWIFLYVARDNRRANSLIDMLRKTGPGLGIDIAAPSVIQLKEDRIENYIQALRKGISDKTQLVLCLFPSAREDRYSAVKKLCCSEKPVPSQIVLSSTLSREDRMRSVVQNIALQINNKLGGASWAVRIPFSNTMICGIDTYHAKFQMGNSVAGFVASTNIDYTEWFSKTVIQGPKEELVEGLIQSFSSALRYYLQKNFTLPERIVVFRDGISYGQINTCLNFEVKQFLEACQLIAPDYKPKFSFVIVHKRINARFYEYTNRNLENPRPGGVVDHTITSKKHYDFFLVSQFVRLGTASPSHYLVIYDNSNIKPDHIQRLTYKFCHLYYNWPGTIRVPAPVQYAHKLAYLVGQNVKLLPHHSLDNKLYYL